MGTDVQMWVETPKGKGKKPVNKDRFISYVDSAQILGTCG